MKKIFVLCTALLLSVSAAFAEKGTLFLYGPEFLQVFEVSANGKWACGIIGDGSSILRAVRWNLTSGEITYLSGANEESMAGGVSNDGVVAGIFTKDGVAYHGLYIDNQWVAFDNSTVEGVSDIESGQVNGITPDGRVAVGSLYINDTLTPVKWENGVLTMVCDSPEGTAYCVSDDGKIVGGWSWETPVGQPDDDEDGEPNKNRVATYWDENNVKHVIGTTGSPWSGVNYISGNGKKLIVGEWGPITIYDMDTQERVEIPFKANINDITNQNYFFINDNGIAFGQESVANYSTGYSENYAVVYDSQNNEVYRMTDWLLEKKNITIDASKVSLMRGGYMSDDEKVISALTYPLNDGIMTGAFSSMIMLLDREITNPAPVVLKANKVHGMNNVRLTWNEPLANAEAVIGYNIYRNDEKITPDPIGEKSYMDILAEEGTYTYAVTAIYDDENMTESEKSEPATVLVATEAPNMVNNLDSHAIGYNDMKLRWDAPASNLPAATYFDTFYETVGFGGGSNSFIAAIRISEDFVTTYAEEFSIARVSFIPRNLNAGFSVKIYADDKEVYSQKINSEDLIYNSITTVTLDKPFSFTANQKILVGIEADATYLTADEVDVIGISYGTCTPGYSDLVRRVIDPEFESINNSAVEAGQGSFPVSWSISALFARTDADGKALIDSDIIEAYDIYRDGEKLTSTTECNYIDTNVATGTHTYGVAVNYADKRSSEQTIINVDMQPNSSIFTPVSKVYIKAEPSFIEAAWEAPLNNDAQVISYAGNEVSSNQPYFSGSGELFTYYVAAEYDTKNLSWYDGYQITSVRFYPTDEATFTFTIEEDDNIIDVVAVGEMGAEDGFALNQWNEYALTTPINIKSGATYRLTLICENVAPETCPISLDNGSGRPGYGDLFRYDSDPSWRDVYTELAGMFRGSWMIGMNINNGSTQAMNVEGYNVEIDGTQVNPELIKTNSYKHEVTSEEGSDHRLKINVVYPSFGEVAGNNVFFVIDPAAVEAVSVDRVKVYPNPATSFIRVEGDVENIQLFDMSGRKVAESATAEMDVTTLPTGNYILKVNAGETEKNVKVVIVR